jgi:hypothetical protein
LVYNGLTYTIFSIWIQQQQEREGTDLWYIETYDLQEILAGIEKYLQKLGDIDPDWE